MDSRFSHYHESDVQSLVQKIITHPSTTWACGAGTELLVTPELFHAVAWGNPYKCETSVVCGNVGHNFPGTVTPSNLLVSICNAYPNDITVNVHMVGNWNKWLELTTQASFAHVYITVKHEVLRFEFELTVALNGVPVLNYIKYPSHIESRLSDCRQCWCQKRESCACCGGACDCRSDDPELNYKIKPLTVEQVHAVILNKEVPLD